MPASDQQHIGVCLSGGGHRASLFGLGALMYLIDADKGPDIAAVSSVSGGSLTNGWVALHTDLTTVRPDEFTELASTLATRIARKGTLWASKLTYLLLLAIAAPIVVAVWVSLAWGTPAAYVAWPIAIFAAAVIAQRRSWVARRGFEQTLFHAAPLDAMHSTVDHLLCATDLQTSEAVYFSSRFVYAYRNGFGDTAGLHVADAAQASAALPGAFPPVSMNATKHGFRKPGALTHFLLSDGGVYDNMGTEWLLRMTSGFKADDNRPARPPNTIDEAVVVNSSASKGVVKRTLVRVPLIGELVTLLAVKDVLYDQTTAVRRRLLYLRSKVAAKAPQMARDGLPCAIVQIGRSPFATAGAYRRGSSPTATRAREVIEALGDTEKEWDGIAAANAAVGTTLSKIPAERAAHLLRHAYVLTMAETHVLLGYPLRPVPTLETARSWLT